MARKRPMTPMERASSLANRRIPKNASNRHTRLSDFMRGYEEGWKSRAKHDPATEGWKQFAKQSYPEPPPDPKPGEYTPGLVPPSSAIVIR